MTTIEQMTAILNDDGYLGYIYVQRPGEQIPYPMHVVRRPDGRMAYFDHRYTKTALKPLDRKTATAVIEDDAAERQSTLAEALRQDRWHNVMLRP